MTKPTILGISGSLRKESYTIRLVEEVLRSAESCGAEVRLLDLREHPLPLYEAHEGYEGHAVVDRVLKMVEWADGYVVGSPEYHGSMSGAMKNFFDFLYREIAGKLFGPVAATGGSQGIGCFNNMRAAIQFCHGWSLPYHVAASGRDFNEAGELSNPKVVDRLHRMGRDMAIYTPILISQFCNDRNDPAPEKLGFAQWIS